MPKSTRLTIVCETALMICRAPGAPTAKRGRPFACHDRRGHVHQRLLTRPGAVGMSGPRVEEDERLVHHQTEVRNKVTATDQRLGQGDEIALAVRR